MRPWIIVLSSAIGAVVVASLLAVPEVLSAPRSEIGPIFLSHLAALAVAGLAVYALCAMLLTTATLVAGTLRLRHSLARTARDRMPAQPDWLAAFGANGFRQLASRLAPMLAQPARDGGIVLQRLTPRETRGEIARLLYISLARSHFFSALIVLAGVVALGLAQDHGSLAFRSGAIPTISAILIFVGLVLLAVLGRVALDVTTEPLLETISQLPAERVEVGLLRHAVELLEGACNASALGDRAATAPAQLPERLVVAIEQGHYALLDAVGHLSANTQALEATVQSSAETIEATIRTAAARQPPIDDRRAAAEASFPELQAAVEELTAVLQRLSVAPEEIEAETVEPHSVPVPRTAPAPRLARELRRLLQEIDATR